MNRPWVGDHGPRDNKEEKYLQGRGGQGAAGASHLFRDQDILSLRKQMTR